MFLIFISPLLLCGEIIQWISDFLTATHIGSINDLVCIYRLLYVTETKVFTKTADSSLYAILFDYFVFVLFFNAGFTSVCKKNTRPACNFLVKLQFIFT